MEDQRALVREEETDGVVTITLDSPHNRNALSARLLAELAAALERAVAAEEVRVIVLTGAGPVFCSGADLKEQRAGGAPVTAGFPAVIRAIWDSPKPVVCRLNGTARAGGLGLVAACDLAIAPLSATFAFSEVRLGVAPAMIAVTVLRRISPRAAAEYFLTGEVFDAARAAEIGLLTRAVPDGELDAVVTRQVEMLRKGGPQALAVTKRLVREVPAMTVEEGLARMAELSAERFGSAEGQEGIAALLERRPPRWAALTPRDGGS